MHVQYNYPSTEAGDNEYTMMVTYQPRPGLRPTSLGSDLTFIAAIVEFEDSQLL